MVLTNTNKKFKGNSNAHVFKRVFHFLLKHWYIFPIIKFSVVGTLVITLAEDGLIRPKTGDYICNHMYIPACYGTYVDEVNASLPT